MNNYMATGSALKAALRRTPAYAALAIGLLAAEGLTPSGAAAQGTLAPPSPATVQQGPAPGPQVQSSPAEQPGANASPTAGPSASQPSGTRLEEVVVTARRTRENLQTVPVAVTAFSGAAIAQQHIVSPQDLNAKVPSLSVTSAGSTRDAMKFTIRGQGESDQGGEPAVVTYFAEVPAVLSGPGSLFDLGDLQVLKGPQGTLFGRNTTGGAVLVDPQRPTNNFGGYVDLSAGDYTMGRAQAAINVPLIDNVLSSRLAIDINHRDGFTKDVLSGTRFDDVNYDSFRLSFLFHPGKIFEDYLVMDYYMSNTHGPGTKIFSLDPNGLAATLFPQITAFYNQHLPRGESTEFTGGGPYDRVRTGGLANITTVHLSDDIYVKNILGIRQYKQAYTYDVFGVPVPLISAIPNPYDTAGSSGPPSQNSYTEEFQLGGNSFGHTLKWLLGIYDEYDQPTSKLNKEEFEEFGLGPYILQSLNKERSRAVFGQFTYDLSRILQGLKFTGGIRYTADRRSQDASQYLQTPANCNFSFPTVDCQVHVAANFEATTGTVGFDYQITPRTLLYVASRHGYKSGGFNSTSPFADTRSFQPEYVTDLEVGEKSDLRVFGVNSRVNADVYRQWYSNIQQPESLIDNGQALTVTQNTGNAIIEGMELEYTLLLSPRIELSGFWDYTHAYYTDNVINGVNLKGLPFNQTPDDKAAITATYHFIDLPDRYGALSATIDYTYQTHVEFQVPLVPIDPDPNHGQGGYGLANFRVNWNNVYRQPIDATFFMTNVTDKAYKLSGTEVFSTLGIDGGLTGEPRMFGFEVRYHFGG